MLSTVQSLSFKTTKTTKNVSARSVRTRAVKAMANLVTYVKGEPKTNTLLDCPFCHRVLLTLETKGVHYDLSYVDFNDKPKWIVDEFEGKVPIIQDGDFKMSDSDRIVVWLEEKYPEPSMKSTPPESTTKIFPAFRGYLFSSAEEEAEKKAAFIAALDALEETLASIPGPLFGGQHMDATDASLAPKLYHAFTALKHFKGWDMYDLPADKYPAIKKYRLALAELPAWKKVDYGQDVIIKGWQRHLAAAH